MNKYFQLSLLGMTALASGQGSSLADLLKAANTRYLEEASEDAIDRIGHSMLCMFSSTYNDEGTRQTQGIDQAFKTLYLGPTDSHNLMYWDKEKMPTGFSCEGTGMDIGVGPLKYILTQEDPESDEKRSWLISEENLVDREFGLSVQMGTKFTIEFIQKDTIAVAYGGTNCDEDDDH